MAKENSHRFNFYGRRRGKKISSLQRNHLDKFLPAITPLGIDYEENPNRKKISFIEIFGSDCPVWIEVGFGGGEHLLSIAKENRDVGFIGCEPYINGVAMFLPKLLSSNLSNVRVIMDDARILFEVVPNSSVSKLFLLFPDPWPKRRHNRRRFINTESLKTLKRILKSDGLLYVATDVDEYVRHVLEKLCVEKEFEWIADGPDDWRKPWRGWKSTRYAEKATSLGKKITYLIFRRI